MSQNSFHSILRACDALSQTIQSHISNFIDNFTHQYEKNPLAPLSRKIPPLFSVSSKLTFLQPREAVEEDKDEGISSLGFPSFKGELARPLTKEALGRSTWTLLHTIAAQYPDHPTKQQKRDIKELMVILSRLYPCKECADHFKEVLKANPIQAGSHAEFSQWLCHMHNVVNRSLGKVVFPCQRVDARWGKLECIDHGCDLQGADNSTDFTT